MDSAEAARRLEGLLGADAARLAAEAGLASWQAGLAELPELREPEGTPLPGLGIALAAREHWSRAGRLGPAAALTRGLVGALAGRLGEGHPDVLAEIGALGTLALRAGRADRAVELLREAWEGLGRLGAVDRLPPVARWLAEALESRGLGVEADRVLASTLERVQGRPASASLGLLLAEQRLRRGDAAGAGAAASHAWAVTSRPSPGVARQAGRLLLAAGRPGEALPPLRAAVSAARDEDARADALAVLVTALEAAGAREEATRTLETALDAARRAGGAMLPARLTAAAPLLAGRGRVAEAEAVLVEAMEAERRVGPEDGPAVARRMLHLARFLQRQGRGEEAAGFFEAAVGLLRRAGADEERVTAQGELVLTLLGEAARCRHAGDRDLAAAWAEQATRAAAGLPPGHEAARAARAART